MQTNNSISPIEVLLSVMLTIITMAILMLTMGSFMDGFLYTIGNINRPLSIWGQGIMNTYTGYARWLFAFPVFFIILSLVWGIKTIIKRHEYTTQQDQFYSDQI